MDTQEINSNNAIFALDIGTRSVIGSVGIVSDHKFIVKEECYTEHEERAMVDGQIHDIELVAHAVMKVKKNLEDKLGFKLRDVSIAAAGRFLMTATEKASIDIEPNFEIDKKMIRSLELTAVKEAEKKVNKEKDGKMYCVGYSVKNYYLNGYVISNLFSHKGEKAECDVIATFLPRTVIDSLYSVTEKVGLNIISLTLEPIAAIEAAIPRSLRLLNLGLVDVGAGTSDIAITSSDTITAYGMVPLAGDEVTEAISKQYLVDFNTAENIKKTCMTQNEIEYTDIMGIQSKIKSEDVLKVIKPVVSKIADEVSKKIIELNGEKSPNAVFLVGGGAHTPLLKELLAENLKLPENRVGIRGRETVTDCSFKDKEMGSSGITVLGIALVTIKEIGHDFIDVTFNDNVISLFNSNKHTVADVLLQSGMSPKLLIGRNGKNVRFKLNDSKRVSFGTLAKNSSIKVNGNEANIDTEVREGDNVEIVFAQDGENASPKPIEYVKNINSVSFILSGNPKTMEPICLINGSIEKLDTVIKENDEVSVIYPSTLEEYRKYIEKDLDLEKEYFINGNKISPEYVIKDGDKIEVQELNKEKIDSEVREKNIELIKKAEGSSKRNENDVDVIINGKVVTLKGKGKYVFVDIFDFIDFDLTVARGKLVMTLNGNKAGYYDSVLNGDKIELKWE